MRPGTQPPLLGRAPAPTTEIHAIRNRQAPRRTNTCLCLGGPSACTFCPRHHAPNQPAGRSRPTFLVRTFSARSHSRSHALVYKINGRSHTLVYRINGRPTFLVYRINGRSQTLVYRINGRSQTLVYRINGRSQTLVYRINGRSQTLVYRISGRSQTLVYRINGRSTFLVRTFSGRSHSARLQNPQPIPDFGLDFSRPVPDFGLQNPQPTHFFGLQNPQPTHFFGLQNQRPVPDFGLHLPPGPERWSQQWPAAKQESPPVPHLGLPLFRTKSGSEVAYVAGPPAFFLINLHDGPAASFLLF
eukprot:g18311.t1